MKKLFKLAVDKSGKLPSFAFPGGYPVIYLNGNKETLCPTCAQESLNDEIEDFQACDYFISYGLEPGESWIMCANCNAVIAE